ncbi:MAG: glucose-6-phosphate dehydrogenase [Actinomycetota bacterium]|nr:glucose-6-phosphate dehydrogenase [Actinomycetota bacterium]
MKTDLAPDDHVIVVFGGNGDLSRRKLLPALYHLFVEGLLPRGWRVIGNSRSEFSDEQFDEFAREAVREFGRCKLDEDAWETFSERLSYVSHEFVPGDTDAIADAVRRAEDALGGHARRLFYLAVPPAAFGPITEGLGDSRLTERARVVYEKPFGVDEASFHELNATTHRVLADEQIYTIDHFLGKETLQNVLALRFANGMFEPVWNRQHIDHVQIDVPETLDVGTRAGFYEKTGALRDMLVTHLLQVLSVIAMEPPYALEPKPLLDEKTKVFESMGPLRRDRLVRGQYEGYRQAEGVAADSDTETFVAACVQVDNWRWAGVPFFLRTGKCMAENRQTVTLAFKEPPRQMFRDVVAIDSLPNDHLTLDLGSAEGMSISFLAKIPGPSIELGPARMTFRYEGSFGSELIGPYERLLHDALLGDRTLFTRADGIERTWELVADVLADPPPLLAYPAGSWGPQAATELIAPRGWHLPED